MVSPQALRCDRRECRSDFLELPTPCRRPAQRPLGLAPRSRSRRPDMSHRRHGESDRSRGRLGGDSSPASGHARPRIVHECANYAPTVRLFVAAFMDGFTRAHGGMSLRDRSPKQSPCGSAGDKSPPQDNQVGWKPTRCQPAGVALRPQGVSKRLHS
jgi:hypothetical protein